MSGKLTTDRRTPYLHRVYLLSAGATTMLGPPAATTSTPGENETRVTQRTRWLVKIAIPPTTIPPMIATIKPRFVGNNDTDKSKKTLRTRLVTCNALV